MKLFLRFAILISSVLWLLVACRTAPGETPAVPVGQTPGAADTFAPPLPSPTPTVTPLPTPSATPLPPRALLLAPVGADPSLVQSIQPVLAELAARDGLEFTVQAQLTPEEMTPALRLVVVLPPDPGVAALAAAAPQTQFLALGIPGLATSPNLSLLGEQAQRLDQHAFMGGYLAAVLTAEWRVGAVLPAAQPEQEIARLAFTNGAVFFCGLCRPAYPPFIQYPVSEVLPQNAGAAEFAAVVASLSSQSVKTVYVAPGVDDPALLDALAQAGIHIIASGVPAEGARSQWVASLSFDAALALQELWPALVAGQGGVAAEPGLQFTQINEDNFSPGRQDYVQLVLNELLAGFIGTGVDPRTGQPLP